ncbi:hypothetical protein PHLGIDRAFT_422982 [Phlebiopsis gigantea 11061_1 CR5-6]|uniref:Uncharacterized protein n=1 Tax=Phlebiopsis gigantea (strain 11061_1 CR5-6) TaxID=745531 RepID=A0A0C3PLN5_PHLG1|nr:hypothetical protein PHLGIDRAFT_422982 [Phlebiopsis gigantea 11061_1 CR5-6]
MVKPKLSPEARRLQTIIITLPIMGAVSCKLRSSPSLYNYHFAGPLLLNFPSSPSSAGP